jgi:hypothetical protein
MAYNVYLFNGLAISNPMNRTNLSAQDLTTIQPTLKGYFDKVVQAHDQLGLRGKTVYGTSNVQWLQQAPSSVAPHELLIYLVPSGTTLVTHGKLEQGRPPASHDGFTNFFIRSGTTSGTTAGSEVFPNFPTTPAGLKLVANLMFHEAVHNKLGLNDAQLHKLGGLASGTPQAGPITDTTPLTPSNISLLAAHLDDSRPQWTAGIGLLTSAANVPDSDPTKGPLLGLPDLNPGHDSPIVFRLPYLRLSMQSSHQGWIHTEN